MGFSEVDAKSNERVSIIEGAPARPKEKGESGHPK